MLEEAFFIIVCIILFSPAWKQVASSLLRFPAHAAGIVLFIIAFIFCAIAELLLPSDIMEDMALLIAELMLLFIMSILFLMVSM